jgi:pyruvate-ferredoxin/flavodoxin oxidoreductase
VKNTAQLLEKLKDLKWRYVEGPSKRGRAEMGIVNSTGCTSVWGSTYPFHPYPFPWTSHLFQDSPSVAMGIFEGHMAKMAEGFKAVRMAEKELAGDYLPDRDDDFFRRFHWQQFSADEWQLCPPVVSPGRRRRDVRHRLPEPVARADVGHADQDPGGGYAGVFEHRRPGLHLGLHQPGFGHGALGRCPAHGKQEVRKEISLIGMAHRTSYVMSGTIAHVNHLLESYIDGLNSRRPALFNIYAVCPPEHGVGDDKQRGPEQAGGGRPRLSAVPLRPGCRHHIRGMRQPRRQPSPDTDWPMYTLKYIDEAGAPQTMELPMTFADFAATEARFLKHFRKAPPETWNENMLPVAELFELDADAREGKFPYIWAVDKKQRLMRLIGDQGADQVGRRAPELLAPVAWPGSAGASAADVDRWSRRACARGTAGEGQRGAGAGWGRCRLRRRNQESALAIRRYLPPAGSDYEPVLGGKSPECTACDECTTLAPGAFAYNEQKLAMVINPKGAKFADLVKAPRNARPAACTRARPGTRPSRGWTSSWHGRRSSTEGTAQRET